MERVINSILRIELNLFDDYYPCIQKKTMNVTYFRYKIEYNSLYIYRIIQYLLGTIILLISYKKNGKFNLLIQPILIYRIIYFITIIYLGVNTLSPFSLVPISYAPETSLTKIIPCASVSGLKLSNMYSTI